MGDQLNLFENLSKLSDETKQEPANDVSNDPLMKGLEALSALADLQNKLLQEMLDDMQKDWSEEEKLQINNPKEYQKQQQFKKEEKPEMKELTTEALEVLGNCTVEETIVKLPEGQLDRKTYQEVKGRLELIGGKWKGGKVSGFVFQEDPTDLLSEIAKGKSRNIKKEYQFFATPDEVADYLVSLADVYKDHRVLEPSAGQGSIIKAINRIHPEMMVECLELMDLNKKFLEKIPTAVIIGDDFLEYNDPDKFDRIIANPPFSKNQDIDHIRKMYDLLFDGGRLVTIASKHWQASSNKKESTFREWLDEVGATVEEVEAGKFKESGTMISTVIITIDKP